MAKWYDIRGRVAESKERQFAAFYSRTADKVVADNRNGIASVLEDAKRQLTGLEYGSPHSWIVAESDHQVEMQWRNRSNYVDIGGRQKSGNLTDEQRVAAVNRSRLHYLNDPLYARAVDLTAAFIYGNGVSQPKPSRDVADSDKERVAALVSDFWHDDFNLRVLTGNQAQIDACKQLLKDGEVPIVLFKGETYRTAICDCLDITEVIEHSKMAGLPMLYKRQTAPNAYDYYWSVEAEIYTDDKLIAEERAALEAKTGPGKENNGRLIEDACVIMWRFTTTRNGLRGRPPFYSALDWGAANTLLAGNLQSYVKAVTAIVGKVKGKFTAADISNLQTQLKSNLSQTKGLPAPTGSMRVEGEGQEWQFLNVPSGGQTIFHEGFEVSRLMLAAATGIPVHWLGDPSTGNLATATAMELPQVKMFEGWQQWFVGCYDNLFRSIARLDGIDTDTARFIEIDFPALTQDDFAAKAQGLSTLKAQSGMSDDDFVRQVAYLCQTDDVEGWVNRAKTESDSVEAEMVGLAEHNPQKFVTMFRRVADKVAKKAVE